MSATTQKRDLPVLDQGADPDGDRLDAGIATAVNALRAGGVETFESCEGGDGHAYLEPTVRFHGDKSDGFRAIAIALSSGLQVDVLRRIWIVIDEEPTGPHWEMTFR